MPRRDDVALAGSGAASGSTRKRVHLIAGTRPEAVKLAPLVVALRRAGLVEPVLVGAGQHPELVALALAGFGITPDVECTVARSTGTQAELVAAMIPALDAVLAAGSDAVVVQGDTTSALVGGLLAMWRQVPLVHLEAGLRSGDRAAPFPEEDHRRLLGAVADLHLAPTARAAAALRREGHLPGSIVVVGNTVVDAVLAMAEREDVEPEEPLLADVERRVDAGEARLMLVTAHRRESWGEPLEQILEAVEKVVDGHPDLWCVLPAHPNPAVRARVAEVLEGVPRVLVHDPLSYPDLCRVLRRASLVLTDSGGIQEEAPSFGVPVLVMREVTERVEALHTGWAELVGTDPSRIVAAASRLLSGAGPRPTMPNPFGDGRAAERSAQAIAWQLGLAERPVPFTPC